jgi:hypothetical protein
MANEGQFPLFSTLRNLILSFRANEISGRRTVWVSISRIASAVIFSAGVCVSTALADRPHKQKKDATYVVTGTVRHIYLRAADFSLNYLVEISVDEVEKGGELATQGPLGIIIVSCYMEKPISGNETEEELQERYENADGGYKAVPAEGDQVRAFVTPGGRGGIYSAVFPDWVEIIKRAEPTRATQGSGRHDATLIWIWGLGGLLVGLAGGFAIAHYWRSAFSKGTLADQTTEIEP